MLDVSGLGEGEARVLGIDANLPDVAGSWGDLPVYPQPQLPPGGVPVTRGSLLGDVELVK